ncbi:MAG: S24/S26 family peptidase [Acidobacteriota bacterium]
MPTTVGVSEAGDPSDATASGGWSQATRLAALDLLGEAVRERPALLEVRGSCMVPIVRDGDRVTVSPCRSPRLGDLVLARDARDRLVCHRVLALEPEGLLLAGDRTSLSEVHPRAAVLGRVTEVIRGNRRLGLDSRAARWMDRPLARLHSATLPRGGAGRRVTGWRLWLLERLRLVLVYARGMGWLAAGRVDAKRATGDGR